MVRARYDRLSPKKTTYGSEEGEAKGNSGALGAEISFSNHDAEPHGPSATIAGAGPAHIHQSQGQRTSTPQSEAVAGDLAAIGNPASEPVRQFALSDAFRADGTSSSTSTMTVSADAPYSIFDGYTDA